MTNDKVNEVLRAAAERLAALGYPPKRWLAEEPLDMHLANGLCHAHWMCLETAAMPAERIEKKMRWLGFIQGVLWVTGTRTIEASKLDNAPQEVSEP